MKSYKNNRTAYETTTSFSWANLANSSHRSTVVKIAGYNSVSASPVIKGNFKDPNPHSYTIVRDYERSGVYRNVNQNWDSYGNQWGTHKTIVGPGLGGAGEPPSLVNRSVAYNAALSKLYDKVSGTSTNLAVDIAEWHQTAAMLQGVANACRKPLQTFSGLANKYVRKWKRNGALGVAQMSTRQLADLHLTYTFGAKPLASSLYEALMLSTRIARSGELTVSGSSRIKASTNSRSYSAPYTIVTENAETYLTKLVCSFHVIDPRLNYINSIVRPSAVPWEVIPFSFVVDYFVDIGGYLNLLEASLGRGLAFKSGYKSTLAVGNRRVFNYRFENNASSGNRTMISHTEHAFSESLSFQRSLLGVFPVPAAPSFNVNLGAGRLLNVCSVLRQQIRSF